MTTLGTVWIQTLDPMMTANRRAGSMLSVVYLTWSTAVRISGESFVFLMHREMGSMKAYIEIRTLFSGSGHARSPHHLSQSLNQNQNHKNQILSLNLCLILSLNLYPNQSQSQYQNLNRYQNQLPLKLPSHHQFPMLGSPHNLLDSWTQSSGLPISPVPSG